MSFSRVLGVNHIGLAPKDPDKARWFFGQALGLPLLGEELVLDQKTLTIMFGTTIPNHREDTGERLEILVPSAPGDGPIGKFLEKKGSGIHHVALTVQGLDRILDHLKGQGVRLIDETPRSGAHQTRIAFIHPESTGGLLVELVEQKSN